jgi:Cys-tRNA(Pro)/Cys-tRNA(Cys) deacylase
VTAVAEAKTNAMRIVEKAKVNFSVLSYEVGDSLDGVTAAEKLGRGVEEVYKTLIARGAKKEIYVFIIPVAEELNLKLAARSVGEKNMEMVRLDELLGLTGYIRGGCSPIGMKKRYRTVIDSSAQSRNTVIVSAGKRGLQLEMDPRDLANLTGASFDKIIFDK